MAFDPVRNDVVEFDSEYPPHLVPFNLVSEEDKILGTLYMSQGKGPHPTVILLHGFPGNEGNEDLAHSIKRFGFNALIFHYRGSWGSSGNFSFSNALKDTENVLAYIENPNNEEAVLRYRIDKRQLILAGHSMGGFLALLAASGRDSVKSAASLAGFNFGFFAKYIEKNPDVKDITMSGLQFGVDVYGSAESDSLFCEMMENKELFDIINYADSLSKKNILLAGASYDSTAPVEIHHTPLLNALRLKGGNPENAIIQSGHSFGSRRLELADVFINWLRNIKE